MIKLGIYAICLSLLAQTSAFAYFDKDNDLYEKCSKSEGLDHIVCMSTASAYYDMIQELGYSCASARGLTRQQVGDVLTKFLKENPELRHKTAASLAIQAFTKGFDSKKQ